MSESAVNMKVGVIVCFARVVDVDVGRGQYIHVRSDGRHGFRRGSKCAHP